MSLRDIYIQFTISQNVGVRAMGRCGELGKLNLGKIRRFSVQTLANFNAVGDDSFNPVTTTLNFTHDAGHLVPIRRIRRASANVNHFIMFKSIIGEIELLKNKAFHGLKR